MDRCLALGLLFSLSACVSAGPVPAAAKSGSGLAREDVPKFSHPTFQVKRPNQEAKRRAALDEETLRDEKFLKNARHAIELYREFIKRAEGDDQYAEAIGEAQERITELEETIEFVEAGMRERAAK